MRTLGVFRSKRFATLKGAVLLIQNKVALESYVGAQLAFSGRA